MTPEARDDPPVALDLAGPVTPSGVSLELPDVGELRAESGDELGGRDWYLANCYDRDVAAIAAISSPGG